MIGMQMSKKYISNIFRAVYPLFKSFYQSFPTMQMNMPEKLLILLISPSGVDQYDMS